MGRLKNSLNNFPNFERLSKIAHCIGTCISPYKIYSSSWPSSSGLRGRRTTYHTIFKLADHALFKMVRYVFLRPLRPELVIRLACFPPHPSPQLPSPPRHLVVWCFFSRFKTTFAIFLTFLGYLGLFWASLG
jgi:hypothetical protein